MVVAITKQPLTNHGPFATVRDMCDPTPAWCSLLAAAIDAEWAQISADVFAQMRICLHGFWMVLAYDSQIDMCLFN